jgi:ribosomal protein L27
MLTSQQINLAESIKKTTYLQKIVKTAKERLGRKYADEQRVNNCKVPVEKRGSKPRPYQCHSVKF